MSLKPKKSQTPSEPVKRKDALLGPWGRINSEPQSVTTLRLCKKNSHSTDETHSYPYRVLTSWQWLGSSSKQEELKIEASTDLIIIKGRGLERLAEALDLNALEILREVQNGDLFESENPIWVSSITISQS